MKASWEKDIIYVDSLNQLEDVFENKVGCIVIKNVFTEEFCKELVEEFESLGFEYYLNGTLAKLGLSQYEYIGKQVEYFTKSSTHILNKSKGFQESISGLIKLFNLVGFNLEPVFDPRFQVKMLPGVVRLIQNGVKLHRDYAPYEAIGWKIGSLSQQIAYNFYLSKFEGGTTEIWNRQWQQNDEKSFHIKDDYCYEMEVVKDYQKIIYEPKIGELAIFNSNNFHLVNPSSPRYSLGGFIGRKPNTKQAFMWG